MHTLLVFLLMLPLHATTISSSRLFSHRAQVRPQSLVRQNDRAKPAYVWHWINRLETPQHPEHDSALVEMELRGLDPAFVDPDLNATLLRLANRYPAGQMPFMVLNVLSLMHPVEPELRSARAARLAREADDADDKAQIEPDPLHAELEAKIVLRGLALELRKDQHSLAEWTHLGHLAMAWTSSGETLPEEYVTPIVDLINQDTPANASFDERVAINIAKLRLAGVLERVVASENSFRALLKLSNNKIKMKSNDELKKPDRRLGFILADRPELVAVALKILQDPLSTSRERAQILSAVEVSFHKFNARTLRQVVSRANKAEAWIFAPNFARKFFEPKHERQSEAIARRTYFPDSIESLADVVTLFRAAAYARWTNSDLQTAALQVLDRSFIDYSMADAYGVLVGEAADYLKMTLPVLPLNMHVVNHFLNSSRPNFQARLEVLAPYIAHSRYLQDIVIGSLDLADHAPRILRKLEFSNLSEEDDQRIQNWLMLHPELYSALAEFAPGILRGARNRPLIMHPACGDALMPHLDMRT